MTNAKKGAERTPKTSASMAATDQANEGLGTNSPAAPSRPPRVPMGQGKNLTIPPGLIDTDKYYPRWFAESSIKGGRVDQAKAAYWEHVQLDGTNFKRRSGNDVMYLMQIELKYYKEDQALKRTRSLATLQKETAIGTGEYAPTADGKPEGGDSAVTRDQPYS